MKQATAAYFNVSVKDPNKIPPKAKCRLSKLFLRPYHEYPARAAAAIAQ